MFCLKIAGLVSTKKKRKSQLQATCVRQPQSGISLSSAAWQLSCQAFMVTPSPPHEQSQLVEMSHEPRRFDLYCRHADIKV